ncbi:ATP-binding cassette sub-family C member Sur isoform X2 [Chironomus tepperi]|uniref:ATP-binding cassette sub-family C member Sur isoform X2 n=1 Tax=Chironomus tepperi TaxID=113505 RepID=UPI00391F3949
MMNVNFLIALISSLTIFVNAICACILIKFVPVTQIKTLLRFHNLRAVILLVLCMISGCEMSSAYLLMAHTNDGRTAVSSLYNIESAVFFFISIMSTAIALRFIEIRKNKSVVRWIYLIVLSEIILLVLRIWKWFDVQKVTAVSSLNFVTQSGLVVLHFGLIVTDISTIYFESLPLITSKSCDPTLVSQENIPYKNPYSTFFSKMTFWWMMPLLCKGFLKPLELSDLGNLSEKDTSRYHYDQFLFVYHANKNKHVSLWTCYLKNCWKMLIIGGIFKLFGDLCGLVGPLSISYIVEYINLQLLNANNTETELNVVDIASGALDIKFNGMSVTNEYNSRNDTVGSYMSNLNNETSRSDVILMINYPNWMDFIGNGWIMSYIVLISFLLQGTLSQASTHLVNMEGIKIKNALQGLIYRKILSLTGANNMTSSKAKGKCDNGSNLDDSKIGENKSKSEEAEDKVDDINNNPGTITNLMSEDSLNVMSFFWICHYVWSIPLKIVIVVYCLYLKLGISSLIGSVVTIIVMLPLQFIVGREMSRNSENGAKRSDERLQKIREIFLRIKLIKLNAWEEIFIEKIAECRDNELKYLKIDAFYWTLMTFLTHISSILITIVTFAVYTLINDESIEFNSSNVFTALALFNQLTVPLFILPITIPIIISSIISTRRIERFLSQPEIEKEFEGVKNMARVLCKSTESLEEDDDANDKQTLKKETLEDAEIKADGKSSKKKVQISDKLFHQDTIDEEEPDENLSTKIKLNDEPSEDLKNDLIDVKNSDNLHSTDGNESFDNDGVILRNKNSTRVKLRKQNQLNETTRVERNKTRSTALNTDKRDSTIKRTRLPSFKVPEGVAVCITNAKFSWNGCEDKTTKLLEISNLSIPLGVLTVIVGRSGCGKSSVVGALLKEMQIQSGSIEWNKYATIAYSGQQPWLQNGTIRDNILFGESYHPKRYDKIIETCGLKDDIELLPNGDLTQIGERGQNLSGGQKMRISIARAFYSSANVIILDDAFSSLDNEVVSFLFEKCIKRVLKKYKRTIILVTQKTQLVYSADYIIAMDDMKVRIAGTMKSIKDIDPKIIREWDAAIAKENAKESASGRNAKERWKLFKNISRFGILQRNPTEEDNLSSRSSLYAPFKRTSSNFYGSRLWSDLPLPIDECNDNDFDFPMLRKKHHNDNEKAFRVTSLQLNVTPKNKQPLARHISSPTRFNYSTKLKDNNRVSESSSFSSKMSIRGFIRRMSERRQRPTAESDFMRDRRKTAVNKTTSIRIDEEEVINNTFEGRDENVDRVVSYISKCSEETEDDTSINLEDDESVPNRLKSDEERKYGKIPAKIYSLYARACGTLTLVVFFMSTLLWQALRVYTDVWLREWTDNGSGTSTDVSYYFNVYCYLSGLCIIFALIATPSAQLAGNNSRKCLHNKLVDSIMRNSLDFFQSTPFGRIINRFSFDMAIIDKKIATTSQRLLQFILLCSCAVLINTAINKWFILLTIPILVIYYLVQKFYRESTRELQRIESISNAPIFSHCSETFLGLTTIRAYNQESRFMEILFKRMEENNVSFVILNCSNRWLGIALDYLGAIIVFIAIQTALITSQILPDDSLPSLVGLALQYTLLIPIYLNWVVKLFADMEMYFGACERISYCIDNDYQEMDAVNVYETLPERWPQFGDIEFRNVSLKHANQNDSFIKDLCLNIPAGQRIGICGKSGSGKSSLANSLFGVIEIVNGQILIDDIDISRVRLIELRSRLSIIPQEDGILFCSTIRENLDPHKRFSDMKLWECLERVQLKDLISSLPEKLDTHFSEGEALLSFGQRQLFCLARAVLKGSICLVLDEATSNLDYETELLFLKAANDAFKGKTVITIAHRLYSILDYDRVVIMENGRIIEDGNPKELKANPKSHFTSMLNASDLSSKKK